MLEETGVSERIGQQFGNYRLTSLIGRGGFAEVYLGEHIYLKTQAAIKILQARLSAQEQDGFYAEARTVARLQHEHIVRVLEFGVKEGSVPFLVMEYAPNGTMRNRIPKGTPVPLERILPPFKQVAAALQYAHNERLIHRDIKPENMLLGAHDELLLSDFGVALMIRGSLRQDTSEVAGTITYMAPEQLLGKPSTASDQYALGVVVYEWLSGGRPFLGSFSEIATQHLLTLPASLQEHVPGIAPGVDRVVLTALAKDPQQRFPSVQDFADALEAAAQGRAYEVREAASPHAVAANSGTDASRVASPLMTSAVQAPPSLSQREERRGWLPSKTMRLALLALVLLLVVGSGLAYALFGPGLLGGQQQMQALYASATSGEPRIDDPLNGESSLAWLLGAGGTCVFKGGALHASSPITATCASPFTYMSDFAYQVEMTITQGTKGGLVFRYSVLPPVTGVYYFTVTTQGQFSLEDKTLTYVDNQLSFSPLRPLIKLQHSETIKTGPGQTNLLTVIARGPNIYLYINKQFVGSAKDSTSPAGLIGMFSDQTPDIVFKHVQVWTL